MVNLSQILLAAAAAGSGSRSSSLPWYKACTNYPQPLYPAGKKAAQEKGNVALCKGEYAICSDAVCVAELNDGIPLAKCGCYHIDPDAVPDESLAVNMVFQSALMDGDLAVSAMNACAGGGCGPSNQIDFFRWIMTWITRKYDKWPSFITDMIDKSPVCAMAKNGTVNPSQLTGYTIISDFNAKSAFAVATGVSNSQKTRTCSSGGVHVNCMGSACTAGGPTGHTAFEQNSGVNPYNATCMCPIYITGDSYTMTYSSTYSDAMVSLNFTVNGQGTPPCNEAFANGIVPVTGGTVRTSAFNTLVDNRMVIASEDG